VPMWTTSDGGGDGGHELDVQKRKKCGASGVCIGVRDPSLPVHGCPDRNIFCVSDVFTRYTVRTSEMEGGVAVKRTKLDTGGGVSKKSVFDRTSLMDDPLLH